MTEEKEPSIKLAVLLPAELAAEVQEYLTRSRPEIVQRPAPPQPADAAEFVSGFDPVSLGAFVWIGLKVLGGAAGAAAGDIMVNLVSDYLWEKIKAWREARNVETFELVIRFPSGEIFRVTSTSEEELERLEATLAKHQALEP